MVLAAVPTAMVLAAVPTALVLAAGHEGRGRRAVM
jgi:hypothetical protein